MFMFMVLYMKMDINMDTNIDTNMDTDMDMDMTWTRHLHGHETTMGMYIHGHFYIPSLILYSLIHIYVSEIQIIRYW